MSSEECSQSSSIGQELEHPADASSTGQELEHPADASSTGQELEHPADAQSTVDDEVRRLRGSVRDIIALGNLSAVWSGRGLSDIAESLVDAMLRALRADLTYVELQAAYAERPSTAVCTPAQRVIGDAAREIEQKLAPYLRPTDPNIPQIVASPIDGTEMRFFSVPVGYAAAGGIIAAGSQELGFPTETDQLLCHVAADQAAVALYQADLMEESLQRMKQVAVLEERTRLAREIHDTIAQGLIAVAINLQVAERSQSDEWRLLIREAQKLVQECLNEARRSMQALRPSELEQHSLDNALSRTLKHLTHNSPTKVEYEVTGDVYALPIEMESNILRIAQEAMTNALRHANAALLRVTLAYKPDRLVLTIADNGRGFDPEIKNMGFGITGMRERAAQLKARLAISSASGRGTIVELVVPVADHSTSG